MSRPVPDTRERLIGAAVDVFAARGYEAATTRAIADAAGVAEKTLFAHFGSKSALFRDAVAPAMADVVGPMVVAGVRARVDDITDAATFGDALRAIGRDRATFARANAPVVKLVAQELLLNPEFRAEFTSMWLDQVMPGMRSLVERAVERGELRDLPPELVVRVAVSAVLGYVLVAAVLDPDAPRDDAAAIDTTVDVLLEGLRPR